ncbi:MAG TPA: alcohol dehydrogenase catalytic domain-containing protein [Solirubrobacterales bacterium]|nr:alcohol dehydrogenase catalytic domain-containing protein [Solirubrobacterales bacterium]
MRAVEWEAPGRLRLAERPEPRAEPGQAVVAVSACGICGSDLHSYRSGFAARPGQVLGHEFSGIVVEAPGVAGLGVGDRVTVRPLMPCGGCAACRRGEPQLCARGLADSVGYGRDGAFADRVLIPRAEVGLTVFSLPDAVDDRAAALTEPLAVALHAVRRAPNVRGADAFVLGAGTIGLGVVAFLRLAGAASITVVDPSPLRRDAAGALGADRVIDPAPERAAEESADVVFECAGADATMAAAIRAVRPGGTVVVSALFGRRVEFSPDRLTAKEASLVGAFGYRDEFADVIEALASGAVDGESLISHELPLERIDEAFRIQGDPAASLKVLVRPG